MGAAMYQMMGQKGKPPMTEHQRLKKAQRAAVALAGRGVLRARQ